MPLHRQQVLQLVTEQGFTLLPLHKATKRPMVKWGVLRSKAQPLATRLELLRPGFESDTDWGILNGAASGTYCLDFDSSEAISRNSSDLSGQAFTATPSGGRHYFYPYAEAWGFGLSVQPGLDIPWVTKLYSPPTINPRRAPISIAMERNVSVNSPKAWRHLESGDTGRPGTPDPAQARRTAVSESSLSRCEFIQQFRVRRSDPTWDGRYPVARAYVSCAILSETPDLCCGRSYRWQSHIEADPGRPATCKRIDETFGCGRYDRFLDTCTLAPGARSPAGLANYFDRIAKYHGEQSDANRISVINL